MKTCLDIHGALEPAIGHIDDRDNLRCKGINLALSQICAIQEDGLAVSIVSTGANVRAIIMRKNFSFLFEAVDFSVPGPCALIIQPRFIFDLN